MIFQCLPRLCRMLRYHQKTFRLTKNFPYQTNPVSIQKESESTSAAQINILRQNDGHHMFQSYITSWSHPLDHISEVHGSFAFNIWEYSIGMSFLSRYEHLKIVKLILFFAEFLLLTSAFFRVREVIRFVTNELGLLMGLLAIDDGFFNSLLELRSDSHGVRTAVMNYFICGLNSVIDLVWTWDLDILSCNWWFHA